MILWQILFIIVTTVTSSIGDKVVEVTFENDAIRNAFKVYAEANELDVWKLWKTGADVMASDNEVQTISKLFKNTAVKIGNVSKAVEDSTRENERAGTRQQRFRARGAPIQNFVRYNTIVQYMERLEQENWFATVISIGQTYEGREMKVLRISTGTGNDKKAALVEGGIHAREWLSVGSVVYMINQMTQLLKAKDKRVDDILSRMDFYFLPVANPDGYEYTHTGNRMWRKTRTHYRFTNCVGADPNRNFDIRFGQASASKNPCSDIYPGPQPFSEACTKNIKKFAESLKGQLYLYYGIHAYGQMYFIPYAYDSSRRPADDTEIRWVARISNQALYNVNNRRFYLGPPGKLLYDASGSSMDWYKDVIGVKYSFGMELYPTQNGPDSHKAFLAYPSDIAQSGREMTEAILVAAQSAQRW